MGKYNYDVLEKEILKEINIDKNTSSLIIALYDEKVSLYPLDFEENGPEIVQSIENAFLHFFNVVTNNPNFDLSNFRKNLNKNLIIGVQMEDEKIDAGTTIFDESKKLFGIFASQNLVDRGVIYHELFHYAFRPDKTTNFRRGLNEGYTEALTHRYFEKTKTSYTDNVDYVLKLEQIIGQNLMEEAYSKGDISIVTKALGEDNLQTFEKINNRLDLLLGSYYRVNSGNKLPDEEKRILKAKEELDEYLSILNNSIEKENSKSK